MKSYYFMLSVFFLIANKSAISCTVPTQESVADYSSLIERTDNIVLAKVNRIEFNKDNLKIVYTFDIIDVIKGSKSKYIKIEVNEKKSLIGYSNKYNDFDLHSEEAFWGMKKTRTPISPDCNLYPVFDINMMYLLFLDKPFHVSSFEIIYTENDLWLKKVKKIAR